MDCSGPNDSPLGCDVGEVVGGLVGGLVGGGVGGGVGAGVGLGVGAPSVFVYDERIPLLDRFGPTSPIGFNPSSYRLYHQRQCKKSLGGWH